ncbi:hypothetical protein FOBRF1_001988 [Fusarium oxysporum]
MVTWSDSTTLWKSRANTLSGTDSGTQMPRCISNLSRLHPTSIHVFLEIYNGKLGWHFLVSQSETDSTILEGLSLSQHNLDSFFWPMPR